MIYYKNDKAKVTEAGKSKGAAWKTRSERKCRSLNHAGSVDYYEEFGFSLSWETIDVY